MYIKIEKPKRKTQTKDPAYVAHIPPLEGWYSRDSLCCGVGARMAYITAKCKMGACGEYNCKIENSKNCFFHKKIKGTEQRLGPRFVTRGLGVCGIDNCKSPKKSKRVKQRLALLREGWEFVESVE